MEKNKYISLHKVMFQVMFLIAGSIVLLLGILNVFLIRNHRDAMWAEWKDTLNRYVDEIRDDLDEISSDLYDIYYYDSNYEMLSSVLDIEAFPYAHELEERLKTRMLLKKRAAGYVFYFDDLKKKRYFFSEEQFSNAELEELKRLTSELSESASVLRAWFFRMVNGKAYAIGIYRNNGVSLSEIYCLENSRMELQEELSDIGASVFFENDGEIIGTPETSAKWEDSLNYQDEMNSWVYYYRRQIKGTDLILHLAVPIYAWTYVNAQQGMIAVIMAMVIFVSILFYRRLNRDMFSPLDSLVEDMKRIGGGDWSSGIHSQSQFGEIQQVIETTDRMIEEIEAQKLVAYEKTIQEQKARMQYLSLQLNPHFYLNGLKTLNYLAIKGDNERIQEIIIRLSGYLRYLLQREDEMVTLSQEVEFVKSYINLCEEMSDRQIRADWRIEEQTLNCLVPRLCIQTFVENSVKYTKAGNAAGTLELQIRASRFCSDNIRYLEIFVKDNGAGYREEMLDALNGESSEGGLSVGINNLKRRCGFLYEKEAQYAFYNDGGAVSDIFYPWQEP